MQDQVHQEVVRRKRDFEQQRTAILKLLQTSPEGVTNIEFIRRGFPRFSARIEELRKEGHIILTEKVRDGVWRYRWVDYDPRAAEQGNYQVLLFREGETRAYKNIKGKDAREAIEKTKGQFDQLLYRPPKIEPVEKPFVEVWAVTIISPSGALIRFARNLRELREIMDMYSDAVITAVKVPMPFDKYRTTVPEGKEVYWAEGRRINTLI